MRRRDFLTKLPGLAVMPLMPPQAAKAAKAAQAARLKITDIRLIKIKLVEDKGVLARWVDTPRWGLPVQIGNFTVTEVHTNQGLVGIGPGIPPENIEYVKQRLVGEDPFEINKHAATLYRPHRKWGASVEIALWDLLGKATDLPLYKLWGGSREKVLPYAALWSIGTVEIQREAAIRIKEEGWRAIKLRSGFKSLEEDVRLVEQVRDAVGDDFHILCDGNKAPGNANALGEDPSFWTYKRAYDTAMEYQRLNVYWFEEPLPRYDFECLAELNRQIAMPMAGGEANWGIHEFKWLLEQGCFDILMPEIGDIGPLMSRNVGTLAAAFNRQVSPHSAPLERRLVNICGIHLTVSLPNAPITEFIHEPPHADIFEGWQVFENPPVLEKDGSIKVPQGPGLGVTLRADLIEKV
tara:strand:+ start:4558 stop:5781 length:1224 start_codon:yes stop_codon:yes gene_type:complete